MLEKDGTSFRFSCPNKTDPDPDNGQSAILCLLCGAMVCSNSVCCRKPLEGDEETKIGGLIQHMQA